MCLLLVASARPATIYVDQALKSPCSGSYSIALHSCSGKDGAGQATAAGRPQRGQGRGYDLLRGGTYSETVTVSKSGTSSQWITIKTYPGEKAVLDGKKVRPTDGVGLLTVDGQRYIRISGLTFANSKYYGVKGVNARDLILEDCEVTGSNHGGAIFEGGANITVTGSKISGNNALGVGSWHEALSLQGIQGFSVTNNTVENNGKEGIDAKYGSTAGTIAANTACDNNGPNVYIDAATNIVVEGNTMCRALSNQKRGLGIAVEGSTNPSHYNASNLTIRHNTIFGNAAGITFWIEGGATWAKLSNIRIENNTIYGNNRNNWGGIFFMNGAKSNFGNGNVILNNIFWDNTSRGGSKAIRDDAKVTATSRFRTICLDWVSLRTITGAARLWRLRSSARFIRARRRNRNRIWRRAVPATVQD